MKPTVFIKLSADGKDVVDFRVAHPTDGGVWQTYVPAATETAAVRDFKSMADVVAELESWRTLYAACEVERQAGLSMISAQRGVLRGAGLDNAQLRKEVRGLTERLYTATRNAV
tara:strand:- start:393 stop:734 length:342 start_codon:yes stop_codon:yes gene_type:complete